MRSLYPAAFWVCLPALGAAGAQGAPIEFNREVRPILSDKCFKCHGPDRANRQANLRLDVEDAAKADRGGHAAIVPGDLAKSELIRRITAEKKPLRMPPAWSGLSLSEKEVDILRRWVQEGAVWQKHWSLIPPRRAPLPEVKDASWPRNEIDRFVLEKLEREGLTPSPEADRRTLIRRVSLDIAGLPPTPAEVEAFLRDQSPGAYERVVDRLLSSPRYGERMAARWLDAARYADTNGYQTDGERSMWRWRDWVIDSFNRNMPFDRFTVEQIAGDMLPEATLEQKIATGFNRNHRGNGEGGIIPEEYAVEYVVDRVDTTATVWLGLTMGCARCHDHKYDPITQKEYYQVFAYFNNVPEKGKAWKYGNSPPLIPAPTEPQQAELRKLDQEIAAADRRFLSLEHDRAEAQRRWEKTVPDGLDWSIRDGLAARYGPGLALPYSAGDVGNYGFYDKFTLAARVYAEAPDGALIARAEDVSEGEGYGLYLKKGKLQVNLVKRWLDDAIRVETETALPLGEWHHVSMTYDGSRLAGGIRVYVDGKPQKITVLLDDLNQSFNTKEPLRVGAGGGPANRFRGQLEEVRIYGTALSAREAAVLAAAAPISAIARKAPGERTPAEADKIDLCFLDQYAPEQVRQAWRTLSDLRRKREKLVESFPTVMVMQERPELRTAHVLLRGAYDHPGEAVNPGVPAVLPPLPEDAPNNRLGFARWLVDPRNPLTARVTVNRFWQMYFGSGLVKTVEDFGSQGEWPSHPELLDWLATEFVRTGWDVKALQRKIVTSATYRQSSKVTPELAQKDPDNRLLARGPRFRLAAGVIRDQALSISGLLVEKLGGPSVKPYQPAGLWKELSGGEDYHPDTGEGLYRRSLYTFWKRTVPPPTMMNFDAAGRETCVVRETRTNTPLQALDLMNDVTFLEAARVLAERMIAQGGTAPASRIAFAFESATARRPGPEEARILQNSFYHYLDRFKTDPGAASRLLAEGARPPNPKLDPGGLAAYASVASLILNLDETVTKE